jgi:hypothetical protein
MPRGKSIKKKSKKKVEKGHWSGPGDEPGSVWIPDPPNEEHPFVPNPLAMKSGDVTLRTADEVKAIEQENRVALFKEVLQLLNSVNMVIAGPGTSSWRGWLRKMDRVRAEIKKIVE